MNILDVFYFQFVADASGVEKGVKSGDDAAKKLKTTLDQTDLSADKLSKTFVTMAKNGVNALAGIIALGAIKALVNDTNAHTVAVAQQARAIGVNVEQLSAYQRAIGAVGGDAQAAGTTLGNLRERFVEMSRFGVMVGPDAFMFKQLGLSAKEMQESIKDPTIALSALADKFQKMNQTQQLYIGKKLGLDIGTITLLGQGKQAFDEMIKKQKELGAVTQAQADAAMKYKIAQTELGYTFDTVKREIVTALLPAFTWLVKGMDAGIQWMREHKAVAIGLFAAIGAVVATVLVPPLITAAGAMWAFIAPIIAAALPFIALGVIIGLIIDDIEKFRAGQASLIGEILQKWPMIGKIAHAVSQIVQMSFKLITDALKWFGGLLMTEGVNAWNKYKGALQPVIDLWDKGVGMLKQLWEWISKFDNVPAKVLNWIGRGLAKLTGGKYDDVTDSGTPSAAPTATPAQTAALGKDGNGAEIAAKLVASGKWTPEQAAGIAGSFMQESHGKADALNKSSGAYGLGQWLGTRVKDFEAFSGKSLKGSTLDDQIAFFNYETEHKEKRAGDRIRATHTAEDAAEAHAKYYERPGANEINLERRKAYAAMIENAKTSVASTNTPLARSAPTPAVSSSSKQVSVQTGDIHVHTPSTDPKEHAAAIGQHLTKHFNDAMDQHDDGVLL